jgi:hypothetical protein
MNPKYVSYKIGDLVRANATKSFGVVTRSNYWALDEYLGGETQFVDVLFGAYQSTQHPVEYLAKVKPEQKDYTGTVKLSGGAE